MPNAVTRCCCLTSTPSSSRAHKRTFDRSLFNSSSTFRALIATNLSLTADFSIANALSDSRTVGP